MCVSFEFYYDVLLTKSGQSDMTIKVFPVNSTFQYLHMEKGTSGVSFRFQVGGGNWKAGGGTCGVPRARCRRGFPPPAGGCRGPPPENFEKLHGFWCNLSHSRPHFLCPDIYCFLLPSMVSCKIVSWKDSFIKEVPDTRNGRT